MYNRYRHRNYNLSKNKKREYAQKMSDLSDYFENSDWCISSHLDSCYKNFDDFELRISNHSAEYVHDLTGQTGLLINIKGSKLKFIKIIENDVPLVLKQLKKLSLDKYRFINIIGNNINCYLKNYKTKKDVFKLN